MKRTLHDFPVFGVDFHTTVHLEEIDEVVLDSIARADSYWRIAYRYLEMVTLQTSTLPSTWRTTRFPVFCTTTGK